MTDPLTTLLRAARDARYLLTVYGQFGKVMPVVCAEKVLADLTKGLMECDAEGEAEIALERKVNRCLRRGTTEWVDDGHGGVMDLADWIGQ